MDLKSGENNASPFEHGIEALKPLPYCIIHEYRNERITARL
jgi:hypothetical protein